MNLQELITHVAQRPEVRSSLTDLFRGLAELIREHQEEPLKLEALADDLDGSETLALAVVANTPVAPSGIGNPLTVLLAKSDATLAVEKDADTRRLDRGEEQRDAGLIAEKTSDELLPGEALDLSRPANFGERE